MNGETISDIGYSEGNADEGFVGDCERVMAGASWAIEPVPPGFWERVGLVKRLYGWRIEGGVRLAIYRGRAGERFPVVGCARNRGGDRVIYAGTVEEAASALLAHARSL